MKKRRFQELFWFVKVGLHMLWEKTLPWLFPSGKTVFGETYILYPEKHLTGRRMLSLIKPLNPTAWMHLFRETRGAEVARDKGRSLDSVFAVRDSLDLENEATAYRYVRRYAVEVVKTES